MLKEMIKYWIGSNCRPTARIKCLVTLLDNLANKCDVVSIDIINTCNLTKGKLHFGTIIVV